MMSGLVPLVVIVLIYGGLVGLLVFMLILLGRFVKASQRIAGATEEIARNLRDGINGV